MAVIRLIPWHRSLALPIALFILVVAAPVLGEAQSVVSAGGGPRPEVTYATRSDSTAPLRDLPQLPPLPKVLGEVFERPRKLLPNREGSVSPDSTDPAVQTSTPPVGAPSIGPYFEGVGNVNSVLPPDPSGAVGPNNYVQVVNLSFAIWNKSGSLLYGPAANKTLWQGFGGPCETRNDGDPVVLYDELADRWLMSQFALPNFPRGPFYQCIAVSKGGDPTGAWFRYEFTISQDKLNDYPKFGVWPDGYYLSVNQFSCRFISCSWAGQGVAAFERDQMLAGQAARMVFFDLYTTDPNLGGMLPSDLDGAAPPAGTPNYFVQVDDNAWSYSPDQLQMWKFTVNWTNPAASTFSPEVNLPTAAFDSNLCGYSRNCIPQQGTNVKVDAISDRLMYRLQYRNFGSYQTLVLNHTVDIGSDHAGIRWYELRKSVSGWSINQQSTFSPDSYHRWMASAAMNGNGDIGLGYSKSSSSLYPAIVATGRLSTDAANAMRVTETTIKPGTGFQTHSSGRWGDYTQLTVDPVDDCTFWYTNEYYNAGASSAGWSTFIGSFDLGDCGGGTPNSSPTASFASSCTTLTCDFDGAASSDPDTEDSITDYAWNFGDGGTGNGATVNHTYNASGSYNVTLTVTDSHGATGSQIKSVSVSDGTTATTMHVGNLVGTGTAQGRAKWKATATITVVNNNGQLLANAAVSGTFTPGGGVTCTTGTNGQCSVTLVNIPNSTTNVGYQVNNLTLAPLTYDPDSNFLTSITITKQ